MNRRNWTRKELLLVLNLYSKLPFSKYHTRTPEVQNLATLIDRTPSAVAMKLANFASLDDTHQQRGVRGLPNVSRADIEIWNEFFGTWGDVMIESEEIFEDLLPSQVPHYIPEHNQVPQNTEKEQLTKIRVGQRFFRSMILGNYNSQCCICALPITELLIASHIIPWSHRVDLRLNPHNGLCLCSIHDKAFDIGYLALGHDYQVLVSHKLQAYFPAASVDNYFLKYENKRINLPDKFIPHIEFTEYHRTNIFQAF